MTTIALEEDAPGPLGPGGDDDPWRRMLRQLAVGGDDDYPHRELFGKKKRWVRGACDEPSLLLAEQFLTAVEDDAPPPWRRW